MQVAVDALGGPAAPRVPECRDGVEGGPQPRYVRDERRDRLCGRLQAFHHPGHQVPGPVVGQGRRRQRGGERRVHLGRRPAEGMGLGDEVPPVGQGGEGELPPVLRAVQERLQHAERERFRARVRLEPGHRCGYPAAALTAERERQFEIGVGAGEDPAEDLQDERVPVDERGVGLLGVQEARRETRWDGLRAVEAERAEGSGVAEPFQQEGGDARVVQPLVQGAAGQRSFGDLADACVRQPLGQCGAHAEQELVAVALRLRGAAARLVDPDEQVQQPGARARGVQWQYLRRRDERESGDGLPLAGEPPLTGHPLVEQRGE